MTVKSASLVIAGFALGVVATLVAPAVTGSAALSGYEFYQLVDDAHSRASRHGTAPIDFSVLASWNAPEAGVTVLPDRVEARLSQPGCNHAMQILAKYGTASVFRKQSEDGVTVQLAMPTASAKYEAFCAGGGVVALVNG